MNDHSQRQRHDEHEIQPISANHENQTSEVAVLRQQFLALQQEVTSQRAQIAALIQQLSQPMTTPVEIIETREAETGTTPETTPVSLLPSGTATTSRRGLLKWAGLGAAAALAAGAAGMSTTPVAHAADGDNLVLGTANSATTTTSLDFTRADPNNGDDVAFAASNGTPYNNTYSSLKTAIRGISDASGVVGVSGGAVGYPYLSGVAGVLGYNTSGGVGVEGQGYYDFLANGSGFMRLKSWGGVGAPTYGGPPEQDPHLDGEIVQDNNGDWWVCVQRGASGVSIPSRWKKLATLGNIYRGGAVGLLSTPIRIYDTRKSGGPFHGNAARNIQVADTVKYVYYDTTKVPFDAAGCVGNLTITNPTAGGYAVIYPQGSATPSTSTVNFLAGQTRANSFIVGLGSTGQVTIHTFTSGQCDVILDITGFIN